MGTVDEVRLVFGDKLIATHRRCWEKEQFFYQPIHYLSLLERKPGGFDFARASRPVATAGVLWPASQKAGSRRSETRNPVSTSVCSGYWNAAELSHLTDAIEYALDIDVIDPDSIRVILEHRQEKPVELFSLDGRPQLKTFHVETTDVSAYAALAGCALIQLRPITFFTLKRTLR